MAFGYADIRGGKAELNFIYQYVEGLNDTEIVWMGPEYGDGDESKNSLGIAIARHKDTQDYVVYHLGRNDDKEYAVTRSDAIGQLVGGNAVLSLPQHRMRSYNSSSTFQEANFIVAMSAMVSRWRFMMRKVRFQR